MSSSNKLSAPRVPAPGEPARAGAQCKRPGAVGAQCKRSVAVSAPDSMSVKAANAYFRALYAAA